MKRKFLKGIALTITLAAAFMVGKKFNTTEKIKVESVLYESTESFKIEGKEVGIEFSDGSWASVDESNGRYVFQPVGLGDWSMNFDNLEDFKKCVKTYIEIN